MYPKWRTRSNAKSREANLIESAKPSDPSSLRSVGMTIGEGYSLGMAIWDGSSRTAPTNNIRVVVFTVNGQRTTENDLQFFAQNNGLILRGFLKSKKNLSS